MAVKSPRCSRLFKTISVSSQTADFAILGVGFRLDSEMPAVRTYIAAFLGAYDTQEAVAVGSPVVVVKVVRTTRRAPLDGDEIDVHRSRSQPYWNIKGRMIARSGGREVAWLERGVTVDVDHNERRLILFVNPALTDPHVGEAVFHCCRSVALSLRDRRRGNLLHASAVTFHHRAVLFCGEELAGKSTLFAAALFHADAAPLASDRVLVSSDPVPTATSWPGYINLCEGTILDFPPLALGARRHEDMPPPWRTQSWHEPLRPVYEKTRKRMYPMAWLVECLGRGFIRERTVGAIVLPRVSSQVENPGIERMDLQQAPAEQALAEVIDTNRFDTAEPAFLPWHGFARPTYSPTPANLARRLAAAEVTVWRCRVRPPDLRPAIELFVELRSAAANRGLSRVKF